MKIKYPLLPSQLLALMKNRTEAPLFNQTENWGKTPTTDVVRFKTRLNEYALFGGTISAAGAVAVSGTGSTGSGGTSSTSLTIRPADITPGSVSGFGLMGDPLNPDNDRFQVILAGATVNSLAFGAQITRTLDTAITDWTNAAGYDFNTSSYAVTAVFNSYTPIGGTTTSNFQCILRILIVPGAFQLCPIDETDTQWQMGINGLALQGTFTLPVTLSKYEPITQVGLLAWC